MLFAQLGDPLILQEHRVANAKNRLRYRLTNYLLSAQCFANERIRTNGPITCVYNPERRPGLKLSKI